MSDEQQATNSLEVVSAVTPQVMPSKQSGELTEREKHLQDLSFYKGIAPGDIINRMTAYAVAIKDALFIPEGARGSAASVFYLISTAEDLGLKWNHGLRSFYITPRGGFGMQSDVMRALLLMHKFKIKLLTDPGNEDEQEYEITRPDDSYSFRRKITWKFAQEQGWPYTSGGKFKPAWLDRPNMLRNRSFSFTAREVAPDLLGGIYTPDELQDPPEAAERVATVAGSDETQLAADPRYAVEVVEPVVVAESKNATPSVEKSETTPRNGTAKAPNEVRKGRGKAAVAPENQETAPVTTPTPAPEPAPPPPPPVPEPVDQKQVLRGLNDEYVGLFRGWALQNQVHEITPIRYLNQYYLGFLNVKSAADLRPNPEDYVPAARLLIENLKVDPRIFSRLMDDPITVGRVAGGHDVSIPTPPEPPAPITEKRASSAPDEVDQSFPQWNEDTREFVRTAATITKHPLPVMISAITRVVDLRKLSEEDARTALMLISHSSGDGIQLIRDGLAAKKTIPEIYDVVQKFSHGQPLTLSSQSPATARAVKNALTDLR